NSEFFIKRLSLYPRRGLVSLFDEKDFIALSDRYLEDTEVVVEGVVTWSINDTRTDVFDDRPCM
ncbi:TPA: LexA family transcriptional regulator, partial [Yersinia enterocolitica]